MQVLFDDLQFEEIIVDSTGEKWVVHYLYMIRKEVAISPYNPNEPVVLNRGIPQLKNTKLLTKEEFDARGFEYPS